MNEQNNWVSVGSKSDLIPGSGVGAMAGERQIALFLIPEMDNKVFAVSNYCPFSKVHIIARGILGDIGGEPVVASPLYKQHFSLIDGHCFEEAGVALATWDVRLEDEEIQVKVKTREELAA